MNEKLSNGYQAFRHNASSSVGFPFLNLNDLICVITQFNAGEKLRRGLAAYLGGVNINEVGRDLYNEPMDEAVLPLWPAIDGVFHVRCYRASSH